MFNGSIQVKNETNFQNNINFIKNTFVSENNSLNLKTDFFWENIGQDYPFNPKLNYCIFFNGCCCPPHIGHINSIKQVFSVFGDNCKIIINQIGNSKRHGVPSSYNSFLLKLYLDVVFDNNPNIQYMFRARNREIFFHPFVLNSNVLVIVRGDELDYDSNTNEKTNSQIISEVNLKNLRRYSKYISLLNKKNIKIDFWFQPRDIDTISASKFIEALHNYKYKKFMHTDKSSDLYNVLYFIPDEFNIKYKYKIVKKLLTFDTFVKHDKKID